VAREAALAMSRDHHDKDAAVELLINLRWIFDERGVDRLASAEIIRVLNAIDGQWSEWRGIHGDQQPRQLSQHELSRMLRPFGIIPRSIWPPGPRADTKSGKGYYKHQFVNAWRSYGVDDETGTSAQPREIRRLRQV
jgi:hypothetical protein